MKTCPLSNTEPAALSPPLTIHQHHAVTQTASDDEPNHRHISLYRPPEQHRLCLRIATLQLLLEPPSYADVIFTSFNSSASASNGHGAPKPESDPPARSDFLKVFVSDPQKELEFSNSLVPGGTSYYTHLITMQTNLPEYGGDRSKFTVQRRFKDVVTLSDRLAESYHGFFIPIRPDKSVVESQMMQIEQFVEQRRAALSRYQLNKLGAFGN